MNIFNRIIENELDMMNYYITNYTWGHKESRRAPLEKVMQPWDENKVELYKLFGNELIISKEISFTQPDCGIEELIRATFIHGRNNEHFNEKAHQAYKDYRAWIGNAPYEIHQMAWEFDHIVCSIILAKNKIDFNYKFETSEGTVIDIQSGMKPMKILSKLNKVYHFTSEENLEKLRIAHSQCLNKKTMKGKLCLSIHPLDFMTMSDNANGWSSCMSWESEGCYRRGTVEMMTSPMVLVAYLKSSNDYYIGNQTWNSKKWRQLMIFDSESGIIAGVKGYPFSSKELTVAAMDWMAELANQNLGIKFNTDNLIEIFKNEKYKIDFSVNYMYNDFGTDLHYAYVTDYTKENNMIYYSGPSVCMWCGEVTSWHSNEGVELICEDCDDSCHCDCCNYKVHGEVVYINGNYYCESCFDEFIVNNLFYTDTETGIKDDFYEFHVVNDSILELINEADEPLLEIARRIIHCPYAYAESSNFQQYIDAGYVTHELRTLEYDTIWGHDKVRFISRSDLTDEGLRLYDEYNPYPSFYDFL